MRYWTRAQWEAMPPARRPVPMPKPVGVVYVHHDTAPILAPPTPTIQAHQRDHIEDQGWSDIAYQEWIAANGDVYEGRGFDVVDGATGCQGGVSLSICLQGNFENVIPTARQLDSLVARIVACAQEGRLTPDFRILAHNQAPPCKATWTSNTNATLCCGKWLIERLPEIRARVHDALHPLPVPDTPLKDTDMYFIYRLNKAALGAGEAVDWIVPPNGPKFHCPSTAYTSALKAVGAKVIDLTGDADASKVFRNAHP